MKDKENRLYAVIRFTGNNVIEFYKALYDNTVNGHYEARDLLLNSCEMRQTSTLVVFLVKCSEIHASSYGITSGDFTMMYSMDNINPTQIDVYTKHKQIEW